MTIYRSPEIKQPSKKEFLAIAMLYVALWAVALSAVLFEMRGAA